MALQGAAREGSVFCVLQFYHFPAAVTPALALRAEQADGATEAPPNGGLSA